MYTAMVGYKGCRRLPRASTRDLKCNGFGILSRITTLTFSILKTSTNLSGVLVSSACLNFGCWLGMAFGMLIIRIIQAHFVTFKSLHNAFILFLWLFPIFQTWPK